jgi:hypothetical protein
MIMISACLQNMKIQIFVMAAWIAGIHQARKHAPEISMST